MAPELKLSDAAQAARNASALAPRPCLTQLIQPTDRQAGRAHFGASAPHDAFVAAAIAWVRPDATIATVANQQSDDLQKQQRGV